MSDEEIDVLYNEILKLPKIERPISATTQCEINVNDLFDTIRAFRKIPDYNELIKDNRKKGKEIERLNNIINELERYINEEYIYDELGMKIFDASILQDKLQELKGSDKE